MTVAGGRGSVPAEIPVLLADQGGRREALRLWEAGRGGRAGDRQKCGGGRRREKQFAHNLHPDVATEAPQRSLRQLDYRQYRVGPKYAVNLHSAMRLRTFPVSRELGRRTQYPEAVTQSFFPERHHRACPDDP